MLQGLLQLRVCGCWNLRPGVFVVDNFTSSASPLFTINFSILYSIRVNYLVSENAALLCSPGCIFIQPPLQSRQKCYSKYPPSGYKRGSYVSISAVWCIDLLFLFNWGMMWLNFSASSGLTEEQQQIYKTALDFAHLEMRPHMAEWDENVCIIVT